MPELPEVSVIVNSLDKKLSGLVLESIEYDWPRKFYWNGFLVKDLMGQKIKKVERMGKVVVIELTNDKGLKTKAKKGNSHLSLDISRIAILIHLKLTGQLIYQKNNQRISGGHPIPPLNLPVPNKSTRVTFSFSNGGHLFFNDLRKFGWVKIVKSGESQIRKAIGFELGPDALEVTLGDFSDRLKKRGNVRIKKLLMEQNFISGIGNIYSDEALWIAKIHPKRIAGTLTNFELKSLHKGILQSLNLAIEKGGSSVNAFVGSGGERGLYLSFANAYHMTGKPCARCGTLIVREKLDGRSAHYCPKCQILK